MKCYVQVAEEEGAEVIELPIEDDGTMLLTTLTSQFPGASGLKYRNDETNTMRAVALADSKFSPPERGWTQSGVFYCVFPKGMCQNVCPFFMPAIFNLLFN